jgi:dipeptidyl aminopeptidase/acylaminoacyl peptidase
VDEAARKASPYFLVTNGQKLPPFNFMHGDADPLVPLQQSEIMVAKLKEAGADVEFFVKPGGGHPWLTIPMEVLTLADWFDKKLKG